MKQANHQEKVQNQMKKIDQMKSIAYAYASNRECVLQEAMYQIMLEF